MQWINDVIKGGTDGWLFWESSAARAKTELSI